MSSPGEPLAGPLKQEEREDLRWYLEEYWQWPYEGFAQRGGKVEALLPELGRRLYKAVFSHAAADRLVQRWLSEPAVEHQVSIISSVPRALSLPWELLHDEHNFLVLRSDDPISVVRRLPQVEPEQGILPSPFQPPLRILLVTSRPNGTDFIDPRSIARELLYEVQNQGKAGIELEFLRPPTKEALIERLKDYERPIHILHFDGHGKFENPSDSKRTGDLNDSEQGMLAFEDDRGDRDWVTGKKLAEIVRNSSVQLVVLNACQSAVSSSDDVLSSIAAQLVQGGVHGVVAMSADFLVVSAAKYVKEFYRLLAKGTPVSVAQEQARLALYKEPHRHPHSRHLDEPGEPVRLYDWWLPHFYQQRPLILHPENPSTKPRRPGRRFLSLNEQMPLAPRCGFVGRALDLLLLERILRRQWMVVVHGFSGIGKTAFIREAAEWFTRTGMYDGACYVSFEHGGDAALLLRALGSYLKVYASHIPDDETGMLARLGTFLRKKHILVIADHLENILPHGEMPATVEARSHLWDVLFKLRQMGAGVVLVSRTTAFEDSRFDGSQPVASPRRIPPRWAIYQTRITASTGVVYYELGGLSPEEGYTLASNLLEALKIDRAQVPYREMHGLLAWLDYHPLAIQCILPMVRERSLAEIRANIVPLLSHSMDNVEAQHNRSLLASLECSLQRISEPHKALLPRLILFEHGAIEDGLLQITEIPKTTWLQLCAELEQAALLRVEHWMHQDVANRFLHFHPLLIPFLRSQSGTSDNILRERYIQHYDTLVEHLHSMDDRKPEAVRIMVQKELANLRHALQFLRQTEDREMTSSMAFTLAIFLDAFGRARERGELLRQTVEPEFPVTTDISATWILTPTDYLRESSLGQDEFKNGNLQAARTRFSNLVARIEAQPEDTPLGRGSLAHYEALHLLARCLRDEGRFADAEEIFREAVAIIDALLKQQPGEQDLIDCRMMLLHHLGYVLLSQRKFIEAGKVLEEALKLAIRQRNQKRQIMILGDIGTGALNQGMYAEAEKCYKEALEAARPLKEPALEVIIYYQLGRVAEEQEQWSEAERHYRESLALAEPLDNQVSIAMIYNQLALVTFRTGHASEAEGWARQALHLIERAAPDSPLHQSIRENLALFHRGLQASQENADGGIPLLPTYQDNFLKLLMEQNEEDHTSFGGFSVREDGIMIPLDLSGEAPYECRLCHVYVTKKAKKCPNCGISLPPEESAGWLYIRWILYRMVIVGSIGWLIGLSTHTILGQVLGASAGLLVGFFIGLRRMARVETSEQIKAYLRLYPHLKNASGPVITEAIKRRTKKSPWFLLSGVERVLREIREREEKGETW